MIVRDFKNTGTIAAFGDMEPQHIIVRDYLYSDQANIELVLHKSSINIQFPKYTIYVCMETQL